MKNITALGIVGVIFLALILGCTLPEKDSRSEQTNTAANSASSPKSTSDIDSVLAVPINFKPDYKILQVRDVSTNIASRFIVNISLPKGVTKQVIEDNLKYAAKEQYEKNKSDAIQVFAFPVGLSADSSNSIGSLEFAPYGDWGRAGEKTSLDKYKAVVKIKELAAKNPDNGDAEMLLALSGDYQAQRNIAFYYSTGAEGRPQNLITGCAWQIVILKSKHAKADSSDTSNKFVYCDQQLTPQQIRQAEADVLLKKIKAKN